MLANELIDRLERLGLLDQEIIEALREQLEQGGTRVTPEAVAKLLVDNGQLTHFQATKLIGELRSGQYAADEEAADASDVADLTAGLDETELVAEEVEEVMEVEAVEVAPVAVEAVSVEAVPVEAVAQEVAPETPRDRPRSRVKKPDPEKSVWDSFKIYGFLGIIAILLLSGFFFIFVLGKEGEDVFIGRADEFYEEQQNYTGAQEMYITYLDSYGEDAQFSSKARVRIVMTELYKAKEFKQEPWRAVDLAKEKLPSVAEEEGMNEERGNLAALLVEIAANMADAAGKAKETPKKQELLDKLDEQRELMEDPMYMSSSMKTTLSSQIQSVEEARQRVKRDISRNIRLDEAEASMKASLDQKATKEAYDTRNDLLRDFPELHDHERLVTLIKSASKIQETLVKPSPNLPETEVGQDEGASQKSIVLTTLVGREAPDLRGETLYFRAGGSILAFDGENGKLRWRKFVGYAKDLPPVRVDDGVLLSESSTMGVIRCGAEDGKISWRSKIDEPFSLPISVKNDVYVSTKSGRLLALDADSGDPKWACQIPQPLETGPGVNEKANRAYLPGNHSNLYLINTRDGSCLESYYTGHAEGTITVPPVPLLGHLFVIENAGSDYANVHVLKVDELGQNLQVAQPLFRLIGNVRVPPIIQGRRLIVLTDRGEVMVFDIEPTAEQRQVSIAARLAPFYDHPTATQMAVGRSQMWITGTRIGRYELQINTGKVVRSWSLNELDTFIGKPFATNDALVHARVLRDTSAIRVTAADPKSGDEIWRTDVGVPVSMLLPASGGLHCITSQAALFKLDRNAIGTGSTQGPIENPGDKAVSIRYEDPVPIDESRWVMLNQAGGQSMVVYDPNRERQKLRRVTMNLGAGEPSGGAIVAGGGVFIPLDTGRCVLVDWKTGVSIGSPFQPASDPTAKMAWTKPIVLPDDPDQVILADSRKKIYRLRVGEQIRPLATKDIEYEFLGPTAGVEDTMLGTTSGPAADFVIGIEMGSLNEKFKTLLDGRVIWGPVAAGNVGLLQTDDAKLRGFAADGTQKFEIQLPEGEPVGKPVVAGGKIILAGETGWLVVIDPAQGRLVGTSDLGQPVSATPLVVGTRLLVPGSEGVVYITGVPTE